MKRRFHTDSRVCGFIFLNIYWSQKVDVQPWRKNLNCTDTHIGYQLWITKIRLQSGAAYLQYFASPTEKRTGRWIQQKVSLHFYFPKRPSSAPPPSKTSFTARGVAIGFIPLIYIITVIILHSLISLPCTILSISLTITLHESLDDIMNSHHL